jgi:hypothetical protein
MSSMICSHAIQSVGQQNFGSFLWFLEIFKSILVRPHQMIALKYRHIRFATEQVENIFVLRKFKWKCIIGDNISILKSIEVSTICVLKIGCNFFS